MAVIDLKFTENITLSPLLLVLCMVFVVLGIKLKWFRRQLTFDDIPKPTDRNTDHSSIQLTGVYRPNEDFDRYDSTSVPRELPPVKASNKARGSFYPLSKVSESTKNETRNHQIISTNSKIQHKNDALKNSFTDVNNLPPPPAYTPVLKLNQFNYTEAQAAIQNANQPQKDLPNSIGTHQPVLNQKNIAQTTKSTGFLGISRKDQSYNHHQKKITDKTEEFVRVKKKDIPKEHKIKARPPSTETANSNRILNGNTAAINANLKPSNIPLSSTPNLLYDTPLTITTTHSVTASAFQKIIIKPIPRTTGINYLNEASNKEETNNKPSVKFKEEDDNDDEEATEDIWNLVAKHRRNVNTKVETSKQQQIEVSNKNIKKNNTATLLEKPRTLRELQKTKQENHSNNKSAFVMSDNLESDTEA